MDRKQQEDLWHTFNRFQRDREKMYGPKINKALKFQVSQFVAAKKLGYTDTQALDFITSGNLYNVLKELYLEVGITNGAKHVAYLTKIKARSPIGFNALMTRLLENYFLTELLNTVEEITRYTKKLISDILIKASTLGEGIQYITEQIQNLDFTYQRSRLIARTETVVAANTGAMLAAQTTGLKLNKVWISARDNRTRRRPRDKYDHLHMDGVTIPKEDLFTVTNELMMQPGDSKHGARAGNICNCRCTIGFLPIRKKDGSVEKI